MNRWSALILTWIAATLVACGPSTEDLWFQGDLSEATAAAKEQDTLVFIEFNTEWCSWCRRLESETLTDREVRRELDRFISVQLDAEKEGAAAAREFGIESFPTMIFLDPTGEEVERIVGYLPPEKFVEEVRRIRTGDTLYACLQELHDDPTNPDAIRRAVEGLLERSDPEGAMAKIKKFHAEDEHSHAMCERLMFMAGRDLHYRVYLRAAKLYREGWKTTIDVPPAPGSMKLSELLASGLSELEPSEQAELMRASRFEDASALLGMVTLDDAVGEELFELAAFAFRGGHYELAADLYRRWFEDPEAAHEAEALNRAAWQLYLAREALGTAVAMARQAYSLDPSADIADTLARLLYVKGEKAEAIELELRAAKQAGGARGDQYREVTEKMKAGRDLGDQPAFKTYPGPREISL